MGLSQLMHYFVYWMWGGKPDVDPPTTSMLVWGVGEGTGEGEVRDIQKWTSIVSGHNAQINSKSYLFFFLQYVCVGAHTRSLARAQYNASEWMI